MVLKATSSFGWVISVRDHVATPPRGCIEIRTSLVGFPGSVAMASGVWTISAAQKSISGQEMALKRSSGPVTANSGTHGPVSGDVVA
jgi:hypothetical protein